MEHRLQRVFVDLAGPRNIASAGGGLYLILFKDDWTRMGWLYPLKSKSAVDVAAATKQFLADVGGDVKCFRTDNGADFVNESFARLCGDKTIRHEHTGVDGPKHNGVVERGLGLVQEGGMAACLEAPRLFPGQLPNLDRYWVEAAVYIHERLLEHHGDQGQRRLEVALRGVLWETAAGQQPRLHAARIPPHPPHPQVGA
ncbi:unnamed protein product [Laminaria digitata]